MTFGIFGSKTGPNSNPSIELPDSIAVDALQELPCHGSTICSSHVILKYSDMIRHGDFVLGPLFAAQGGRFAADLRLHASGPDWTARWLAVTSTTKNVLF